MEWYNKVGVFLVILYIIYAAHSILSGGLWEYTGCVVYGKAQAVANGHSIYPIFENSDKIVHTWPYTPLSIFIYAYFYVLFHGSEVLFAFIGVIFFLATAFIAGLTASEHYGKNITLFVMGLVTSSFFIIFMTVSPRPDNIALFFFTLSLYYYARGEDKKSIISFILAFLSKETYFFTLPFMFLIKKKYKQALITLAAIGGITGVLLLSAGFRENVVDYVFTQGAVRASYSFYFLFTVLLLLYSGDFMKMIISLKSGLREYYTLSFILVPVLALMLMKPGASLNYLYRLVVLASISGGVGIMRADHKKVLTALIVIISIIGFSVATIYDKPQTIKSLKTKYDGVVLSDDACVDSEHYDWFFLQQFALNGKWSWDSVYWSVSNQKYDYVIFFTDTYKGHIKYRIDSNVYSLVTEYYTPITTITPYDTPIVIYTPRKK